MSLQLVEIASRIYDAALDSGRLGQILPAVVDFVGGRRGILGISTLEDEPVDGERMLHRLDPELLGRWQEQLSGSDPAWARLRTLRLGESFRRCETAAGCGPGGTPAYRAFLSAAGMNDSLFAPVSRADDHVAYVGVYRSASEGPFEASAVKRFGALVPHLVRGAQIHARLSRPGPAGSAAEAVLALAPYGVIALDAAGRLLGANAEAERILRAEDGLSVRAGRLHVTGSADAELAGAIARARDTALGREFTGAALLRVGRPSLRPAYQVLVTPVPRESAATRIDSGSGVASTAVVISDPERAPRPAVSVIRRLFRLSDSLARLAAALAAGRRLAEYAEEAGISEGTARQQLKEVFARTGTRRQAELVRLLLSGLGQLRVGQDPR